MSSDSSPDNTYYISSYMASTDEDSPEVKEAIDTLSGRICDGSIRLVDVVTLLGDYLTRENNVIRARATQCLVRILEKLPADKLNKRQVVVITNFFCDRLEDEECVPELLSGIKSVVHMSQFAGDKQLESVVLDSLKTNINMRRIVQGVRHSVFQILTTILDSGPLDQSNFVQAFLILSAGEKDPRNLLLSFHISNAVLTQFPEHIISNSLQELFDNVFCYFPITFQQPKNDPYGITPDQLKSALDSCLASNGILAPLAFPALIEKLTAVTQQVKIDALNAICLCLENYQPKYISPESVWKGIWDGVKYEVLHGSDEVDTAILSITVLRALALSLLKDSTDTTTISAIHQADKSSSLSSSVSAYMTAIKTETEEKLRNCSGKMSLPACSLVAGISEGHPTIFSELVPYAMRTIVPQLDNGSSIDTQKAGAEMILRLLTAYKVLLSKYPECTTEFPQADESFQRFSGALMGVSKSEHRLRNLAMACLLLMCQTNAVSKEEAGLIVQYLDDILLSKDEDDELMLGSALGALVELVKCKKEDLILTITFPSLLAQLSVDSAHSPKYILSALSALSVTRRMVETLSIRLLSKLESLGSENDKSKAKLLGYHAMSALLNSCDTLESADLAQLGPRLIRDLVCKMTTYEFLQVDSTVDSAGSLLGHLMCSLHSTENSDEFKKLYDFISAALGKYVFEQQSSNLASLYIMTLACADKENGVPAKDIVSTAVSVLTQPDSSPSSASIYVRGAFCRMLAVAANKWLVADQDIAWVNDVAQNLLSNDLSNPGNLESVCWLAKGLLLRSHALGFQLASQVASLVASPGSQSRGMHAAVLCAVFVVPDRVLVPENGIKVRRLYMQRLFAESLPVLVDGFKSLDTRVNSIVALAGILRYIPSKIVIPELPKILPLLLESFEVNNPNVQEAAINTVLVTLSDASDIFAPHVNVLVPRLLRLSQYRRKGQNDGSGAPSSVRSSAVSCLCALATSVPRANIEPFRVQILQELAKVLDDPKREVRKQAVICRQTYFELR